MSDSFDFTPSDEKLLAFKIVAFRALMQSASIFEDEDGAEHRDLRAKSFQHAETLAAVAANSDQPLDLVINDLAKRLADYSISILPPVTDQKKQFLDNTLIAEAAKRQGIVIQLRLWLDHIHQLAKRLNETVNSLPIGASIQLTAGPGQHDPVVAKTTANPDGRVVGVIIDSKKFGSEDYCVLPYLLSHEFWCHVLAGHVSDNRVNTVPWVGSSPTDLWEEGWMDFVQATILDRHLSDIVGEEPSAMQGCFSRACENYGNRRQEQNDGIKRSTGADDALMFLRQAYVEHGYERGWNLLVALSISINLLAWPTGVKRVFADCSRRHLSATPGKARSGAAARKEDRELNESRNFFWNRLESYVNWSSGAPIIGTAEAASLLRHIQRGIGGS